VFLFSSWRLSGCRGNPKILRDGGLRPGALMSQRLFCILTPPLLPSVPAEGARPADLALDTKFFFDRGSRLPRESRIDVGGGWAVLSRDWRIGGYTVSPIFRLLPPSWDFALGLFF